MALTWSASQDNSSFGNINMRIWVGRGEITGRTETAVSFNFGVCFRPLSANTTNSVAAWYGGVQKFAYANAGHSYDNAPARANKNTDYYAHYDNRNSTRGNTTETTCYSFYKDGLSATTTSVSITIGVGWNNWGGSQQGTLTFNLPIPEYHGNIGTGTTTITDNFNNSFTITATKGANGINNTASGPTNLKWGYSTARSNTYTNGQTIALTRDNPDSATRTVYAESTTTAKHGSDKIAHAKRADGTLGIPINQYYDPGDPGVPALTGSSFKNGRLTVKQNWQYLWTPATKRGCSDVKGYRIRVKKFNTEDAVEGTFIRGLVYNKSTNSLTLGTGTDDYVDTESQTNSITFNPADLGFAPGNKVQLRIHAYSRNGLGQSRWGDALNQSLFSAAVNSEVTQVQNAGIVRIKTSDGWKEGQVYVKVDDAWKEAETVNVKTATGWKESQ